MKTVLIISPYFPPYNTPDMQRVRMSLPYFKNFGWAAEVVTVESKFLEGVNDPLFSYSIPDDIKVHKVSAFSKKWTSKLGLGSIALRSLLQFYKKVEKLLSQKNYDLIYFSTTQFPVCILGSFWKKKFGIPYVIDMQDPWHTDYYKNKPKHERPKKYWFSYNLNKSMEPIAMKNVDGIISVSEGYIQQLRERYPRINNIPVETITFGVSDIDFKIAEKCEQESFPLKEGKFSIVYIGVVGHIMRSSLEKLFSVLQKLKTENEVLYNSFHFYFVGTSYAVASQKTVEPIAESYGVAEVVTEQTNRIPFYSVLKTLQRASGLMIIGTDDPNYTASKTYPYIRAAKPLLAILHEKSSAVKIIRECSSGSIINLQDDEQESYTTFKTFLNRIKNGEKQASIVWDIFKKYSAEEMTRKQCVFFDLVLSTKSKK